MGSHRYQPVALRAPRPRTTGADWWRALRTRETWVVALFSCALAAAVVLLATLLFETELLWGLVVLPVVVVCLRAAQRAARQRAQSGQGSTPRVPA